jgi:hypothetical protein
MPRNSLRGLYYETAQSAAPGTLACLQAVAGDSHVLVGTDYPHMDEAAIASSRQAISEYGRLDLTGVGRRNARGLPAARRGTPRGGLVTRRPGDRAGATRYGAVT